MYTWLKCYSLEMLSDCVNVIVYYGDAGSRINPIKRHLCCVTSLSETPEFVTHCIEIG